MVVRRKAIKPSESTDKGYSANPRPVRYPERDGKPLAESEVHAAEIIRLILTLRDAFADRDDIYVWGDLLLYYEEGNPRASVAPDVFVVVGVPKGPPRRTYKLWEEGAPPTLVIEVTSRSTRREDFKKKRALYARIGVADYFLYDPLAEYLAPALQGFRLEGDDYLAMEADAAGALLSDALDLRLALIDGQLRLFHRRTGALLVSPSERADIEAEARRSAEQRIAELEAELRRRKSP